MNQPGLSEQQIIARIERLPVSRWYARILGTVAIAHFFDAFDSLTIAFILPVLVGLWKINPSEIGLLISAYNSLRKVGGRLAVVHASAEILDLFQTMRMHQHFSVSGN